MSDIVDTLRLLAGGLVPAVEEKAMRDAATEIVRLRNEFKVMTEEHRLACDDRDLMMRERNEARREILLWVKERCSWVELTQEIKKRGWEYLKEVGK